MKKVFALLLTLVMILSLSVTAFAENSDGESYTKGSITIKNPQDNETYKAYKIFDVTYDLGEEGTDDDKYAYTIAPEWVNDVVAYATPAETTLANDWTTTTANGLTVTKVQDSEGNTTAYNVTIVDTFSAADFGEKMAEMTSGKTAVSFTDGVASNLDLGYYMVQPTTANALVSLTTTDKDVLISDKNEKPVVDKKIVGSDVLTCELAEGESHTHGADCYSQDVTTKSVGDKVDFELDTKVPDMTGYETYFFVMNDTLSEGLTFNDDVNITLGGTELTADTHYTVKTEAKDDGTTEIRIVFKNMKQWWSNDETADKAGKPIVITYSATVDEDAVMGTDANSNTAKIEYSNDPNIVPEYDPETPPTDPDDPQDPNYNHNDPEYTGKDPVGESVEDSVDVYTSELDITKVDANGGAALTGAKFKIEGEKLNVSIVNSFIFKEDNENGTWYRLKDGTYTEESPEMNGENKTTYTAMPDSFVARTGDETSGYTYNTPGLYYLDGDNYVLVTEENAASLYTENSSRTYYKATIWKQSDLYEDTTKKYVKVETITKENSSETYTAEGFVGSDGKITFGGLAEGTYYLTELIAPDGYNLLKAPVKVVVELVEGETAGSYKFQATVDDAETSVSENNGVISFNVANNQGIELPETGGIGTYIFYALGGLLVLGAGILLIVKKRMSVE